MKTSFLTIQNLEKTYSIKKKIVKRALRGLSFEVNQGEILGLLGVNGAGKTTLSSILAGLSPPTSGEVLFQGSSIYRDIVSFRKTVGFCPQKPNLDQLLTLGESLIFSGRCYGLSKEEASKRSQKLMAEFKMGAYAESYPIHLSGGYKQRFLIARSMMHHPRFIILDEPTVGLDPHIRHELWKTIKGLKKEGVTVLLTTHYLDEAEALSDRVCFIYQGEVKLIDTPENLLKSYQKKNLEEVFLQFMDETELELLSRDIPKMIQNSVFDKEKASR